MGLLGQLEWVRSRGVLGQEEGVYLVRRSGYTDQEEWVYLVWRSGYTWEWVYQEEWVRWRGYSWSIRYGNIIKQHMLPLIAEVMDPEFWFATRSINFLNIALNSSSQNVKSISNMGCFGTFSIMGGNMLIEKYDMNVKNIVYAWNELISKNEELVRVSEQVKEVVGMRARYIGEWDV